MTETIEGYVTPTHAIEHRYGLEPGEDWLPAFWAGENPAADEAPLHAERGGAGGGAPADFDPIATRTGQVNTDALDDEFDGEDLLYHEINILKAQLEKLAHELAHQMEVNEKLEKKARIPRMNELDAANKRIKELEAQLAGQGEKKQQDAAQPAIVTLQQQWDINKPEGIKKADAEIDRYRTDYELYNIGWNITTKQVTRCIVLRRKVERATIITGAGDSIPRKNGKIDRNAMNEQVAQRRDQAVAYYDDAFTTPGTVISNLLPKGNVS